MSRWQIRFFILLFLFFHLALSFHHHNHDLAQPTCSLCLFILSSSSFIPEDHYESSPPVYQIRALSIENQAINPFLDKKTFLNRSPPSE